MFERRLASRKRWNLSSEQEFSDTITKSEFWPNILKNKDPNELLKKAHLFNLFIKFILSNDKMLRTRQYLWVADLAHSGIKQFAYSIEHLFGTWRRYKGGERKFDELNLNIQSFSLLNTPSIPFLFDV